MEPNHPFREHLKQFNDSGFPSLPRKLAGVKDDFTAYWHAALKQNFYSDVIDRFGVARFYELDRENLRFAMLNKPKAPEPIIKNVDGSGTVVGGMRYTLISARPPSVMKFAFWAHTEY